jgi:hypothetical protein
MSFDPITTAGVKALQGQVSTVQAQTTALTTKLAQIESALAGLGTAQAASRKPLRVTEYTWGAGTHNFLPESTYQHVTLIGAGGAGVVGYYYNNTRANPGTGGGAGDELSRRVTFNGSLTYQVGAGGAGVGGSTRLGTLEVIGGAIGNPGDFDNYPRPTTQSSRQGNGITPGAVGTTISGGSSLMGIGGICGTSTTNPTNAIGYGSGGGGNWGVIGRTATPGAGGYIRIEEY